MCVCVCVCVRVCACVCVCVCVLNSHFLPSPLPATNLLFPRQQCIVKLPTLGAWNVYGLSGAHRCCLELVVVAVLVVVAFSSLSKTLGECSTVHSTPALFSFLFFFFFFFLGGEISSAH